MVPFLNDSLEVIIGCIVKMFILNKVLKEAVTSCQLIKIKISNTRNQLVLDDVKLTTGTGVLLKSNNVNKDVKNIFEKVI